jgi:hypothetical protein
MKGEERKKKKKKKKKKKVFFKKIRLHLHFFYFKQTSIGDLSTSTFFLNHDILDE